MNGKLLIVLHAHLPFVHHPECDESLEENWFFEALSETYIPLVKMLKRLHEENVSYRLCLSFSPTLLEMLGNPLLLYRYQRRLKRQLILAEKEIRRVGGDKKRETVVLWHHQRLTNVQRWFVEDFDTQLIPQLKRLQEKGCVEILGTAATHGYLPLLQYAPEAVSRQLRGGISYYRRIFDESPRGFWLPECGYYPGLDAELAEHGVQYTFIETHGVTRALPAPIYGVYQPLLAPSGVTFFGRDPESARTVWSGTLGYPANPCYREFYRDIAYDLREEDLRPLIAEKSIRSDSGFKYYCITGATTEKKVYDPLFAEKTALEDAADFVCQKKKQSERLMTEMETPPVLVAPFDAELFGHWWGEGLVWLEEVVRQTAAAKSGIQTATGADILSQSFSVHRGEPVLSSWGEGGYNSVWLNEENGWFWPLLKEAAAEISAVQQQFNRDRLGTRAFVQAQRELLLAQASDWAFMVGNRSYPDYGAQRLKEHVKNVHELCRGCTQGDIDETFLVGLEQKHPLFEQADLD